MSDPIITSLSARLEQMERRCEALERRARRWRLAGGMALAGAVVMVTGGATHRLRPDVAEASAFIVRDQQGKQRAALGIDEDGQPSLVLCGADEKNRLSAVLHKDGRTQLSLFDDDEKVRLGIGLIKREDKTWSQISLYDTKKNLRLAIGVGEKDVPHVGMFSKGEKPLISLGELNGPSLALFDQLGKERIDASVGPEGGPVLEVLGGSGEPLFRVSGPHPPIIVNRAEGK